MPFHRLPLCARCCGCSLQTWVVIIALIHGILITVALIHFCIVTMNFKHTRAERTFEKLRQKEIMRDFYPLFKQYNMSAFRICDEVGGNATDNATGNNPNPGKQRADFLDEGPTLIPLHKLPRPTQLAAKLRRHLSGNTSSKENIAVVKPSHFSTEAVPRHFFITSKDVSSIQMLLNNSNQYQTGEYLVQHPKEQQPQEAAELTKWMVTQYPKNVSLGKDRQRRHSQTSKYRGLAYWAKQGLALQMWPWGEKTNFSRSSMYRNLHKEILKQLPSIEVRADNDNSTDNFSVTCYTQAEQSVRVFNMLLDAAVKNMLGYTEDGVSRVTLTLQALGVVLCVASLVTICMLIIGVAELDSRLMVPWMTAVGGFFIFMFYYMYIELFLYTADPIMSAGTFIAMFMVFLLIAIIAAIGVYIVFCLYWLLFTPEGYISKQEAVAQVIVSGRDLRY